MPCPCALCPAPCLRPCPAPCPALCLGPALRPWPWPKVATMLFLRFSGLENLKMESCNPTNGILQPYPALCALPLRALPALPCPWPCPWSWSCKTVIFGFSGLENLKMESCNFAPLPCALPCPLPQRCP